MNLNGILIGSEDPDRLAAYYTRLFGDPAWNEGGFHAWLIGSGSLSIGPHDQVKGRNAQPGRVIWNIETPDVVAEFERFKAAGATVVQAPYHPGQADDAPDVRIATFSDPDDNYFQLVSPFEM